MKPQRWKPHPHADRVYILSYDGGEREDVVVDVQLRGEQVWFTYPHGGHGSAFTIGRIERETAEELSFTTVNPPLSLFEGVVTFKDTGELFRWS